MGGGAEEGATKGEREGGIMGGQPSSSRMGMIFLATWGSIANSLLEIRSDASSYSP